MILFLIPLLPIFFYPQRVKAFLPSSLLSNTHTNTEKDYHFKALLRQPIKAPKTRKTRDRVSSTRDFNVKRSIHIQSIVKVIRHSYPLSTLSCIMSSLFMYTTKRLQSGKSVNQSWAEFECITLLLLYPRLLPPPSLSDIYHHILWVIVLFLWTNSSSVTRLWAGIPSLFLHSFSCQYILSFFLVK